MAEEETTLNLTIDASEASKTLSSLSGLADIMIVLEWLGATKTPTVQAQAALDRLRHRIDRKIPLDVITS